MSTEKSQASRKRRRAQFRIRSLLFTTFVVALCGTLFQLSVVVGCIASVPATLALLLTLGGGENRRHGLLVTFGQSIIVMHCLVVTFLLNMIAVTGAAILFVLYAISSVCARASLFATLSFEYTMLLFERSRSITGSVGMRTRAAASRLHQTNRKLVNVLHN